MIGAVLLLAGAVVIVWPSRGRPLRVRRLDLAAWWTAVAAGAPSWRLVAGVVAGLTGLGLLVAGPVAAFVLAAYAALAGRALVRRSVRRRAAAQRCAALDDLAALAADLRAGLPPVAMRSQHRIARLTSSVWRLAETTGAPAADLVERIEADARSADRAAAKATAQAAGAQATAFLLAALPIGGIGLGFVIGANPLHVLLRTPIGGACAAVAVALQCAGLLWSERLVGGVTR